MKLIWKFEHCGKKSFQVDIIGEFPKVQKDGGTIEVVSSTVISDELKSIESVVEGATQMRLAFIQCVTGDGQITDLKQDDFAKLVSMIEKPKQPPSSNSSDESSEPEESESKVKRQKIWISTTTKPNQQLSLETVAIHELQGTYAKVNGVADVGIFNKSTKELFLLAEGKAKEDEDIGCHGIGQLLLAMLTHFVECNGRNSIVGFTLSPSCVSVFDIPSLSQTNTSVRIRLHGSLRHTGGNLKKLLVLIPYINLAMQQGHRVFKSDVTAEWIDE